MKVILRKDEPKLGEADTLVNVSDGYARNYLFPRKIAVPATAAETAALEKRKEEREKERAKKRAEFEELARKLAALELSIEADVGEEGKLFGSVTSQDIASAVHKTANIEIDRKKIELADPIKIIGEYNVPIKLYRDVSADLRVKVIAKPA